MGAPKSHASVRAIPLASRLLTELDAHFRGTPWNQDSDLVLAHPHTGRPLDEKRLLQRFHAALSALMFARSAFMICGTRSRRRSPLPGRCRSAPFSSGWVMSIWRPRTFMRRTCPGITRPSCSMARSVVANRWPILPHCASRPAPNPRRQRVTTLRNNGSVGSNPTRRIDRSPANTASTVRGGGQSVANSAWTHRPADPKPPVCGSGMADGIATGVAVRSFREQA